MVNKVINKITAMIKQDNFVITLSAISIFRNCHNKFTVSDGDLIVIFDDAFEAAKFFLKHTRKYGMINNKCKDKVNFIVVK